MTSPSPTPDSSSDDPRFHLLALLGAILLPGLGHVLRGERKRGVLAAAGVLGLFLGGLLIGGINAVDRREERWWFYAQAGVGPLAFAVNHVHQKHFKGLPLEDLQSGDLSRVRSPHPGERLERREVLVVDPATRRQARVTMGVLVPAGPGERPPKHAALGKVAELGILFAALAGMLNIIVVLDIALPGPRPGTGGAPGPKEGKP